MEWARLVGVSEPIGWELDSEPSVRVHRTWCCSVDMWSRAYRRKAAHKLSVLMVDLLAFYGIRVRFVGPEWRQVMSVGNTAPVTQHKEFR